MVFRRFGIRLAARLTLLGLLMALTIWLVLLPGYLSATLLVAAVLAAAAAGLLRADDDISLADDADRDAEV